jgi:hypothetical protein
MPMTFNYNQNPRRKVFIISSRALSLFAFYVARQINSLGNRLD